MYLLVVKAQGSFPDSWVEKYQGDLMIYGVDSVRMKVEMKLEILKTAKDSIYDCGVSGTPTFFVNDVFVDANGKIAQKGHYRIDERNSIIIEGY